MDNLGIRLHTFYSQANSTDKTYTDFWENSYDLSKNNAAKRNVLNANLAMAYKNLSATFIADNFATNSVDMFDELAPYPVQVDFQSYLSEIKYDFQVNEKLRIIPKINIKFQKPWYSTDDYEYTDMSFRKTTGNMCLLYDINKNINFLFGGEYYHTYSSIKDTLKEEGYHFGNGKEIDFNNMAVYSQLLLHYPFANLTIGGRYDNHEQYKNAFSPRLGITKAFNRLYFKVLYNRAFRAPSIVNIDLSDKFAIKPEKTYVAEIEAGYNYGDFAFAINAFDINMDNTIVYFYDEENDKEGYRNMGKTGTRGFEFEFRFKNTKWGYATANYSYYAAAGKNKITDYATFTDEDQLIANPQHKISCNGSLHITPKISINPSIVFLSERQAYTGVDQFDNSTISIIEPSYLIHAFISYRNLFFNGLNIFFGVHNLIDDQFAFYQPYDGYHAPFPGKGREFSLKISYDFQL